MNGRTQPKVQRHEGKHRLEHKTALNQNTKGIHRTEGPGQTGNNRSKKEESNFPNNYQHSSHQFIISVQYCTHWLMQTLGGGTQMLCSSTSGPKWVHWSSGGVDMLSLLLTGTLCSLPWGPTACWMRWATQQASSFIIWKHNSMCFCLLYKRHEGMVCMAKTLVWSPLTIAFSFWHNSNEVLKTQDTWFYWLCSVRVFFVLPFQRVCSYGGAIFWFFLIQDATNLCNF